MLTLPSAGVATSRLPNTYLSAKKPPNFHAKALRSSSLSIKKKTYQKPNQPTLKKTPKNEKQQNCLENLCLLVWQPWLGWILVFWVGFGFFFPCFLVSWCQQEILCLTGNTLLPSPSAGIMGEISSAQRITPLGITCPAPR